MAVSARSPAADLETACAMGKAAGAGDAQELDGTPDGAPGIRALRGLGEAGTAGGGVNYPDRAEKVIDNRVGRMVALLGEYC